MNLNWTKIKDFLLDLIFPIECLGCHKPDVWLCQKCLDKISLIKEFSCPFCSLNIKNGKICENCREKFILDGIIIATAYESDVLKNALYTLKYKYVPDIGIILGQFLTRAAARIDNFNLCEYKLIPIPLHKKRFLERGFNQAEFLAQDIAKINNLEILKDVLVRNYHTESQISLSKENRIKNVKNAFSCLQPEKIKNKKIILIDDVFTTGSTMQEAAKELKNNGCDKVVALALAHGL